MDARPATIFEEVGVETAEVYEHTFEECQELIRVIMHADDPEARSIHLALREVEKLENEVAERWAVSYIFGVMSKRPGISIAKDVLLRGAEALHTSRNKPRFFDNLSDYTKAYGLPGGDQPTISQFAVQQSIEAAFYERDPRYMTGRRFDAVKLEVLLSTAVPAFEPGGSLSPSYQPSSLDGEAEPFLLPWLTHARSRCPVAFEGDTVTIPAGLFGGFPDEDQVAMFRNPETVWSLRYYLDAALTRYVERPGTRTTSRIIETLGMLVDTHRISQEDSDLFLRLLRNGGFNIWP
jgi:hypothetical protein